MVFDGGYMHAGGPLGPPVEWVVQQERTNGPWARYGLPRRRCMGRSATVAGGIASAHRPPSRLYHAPG